MLKIKAKKINGIIHVKIKGNKRITYKCDVKNKKIFDVKSEGARISNNNLSKKDIKTMLDIMWLAMLNEGTWI